ncbi:flagellar hook-length control protein FliK [Polaromonas sp. CG_23.6]|uniref:flagellar hook-length control protein FliK n=1 Tax=Polaromonas sp. CG_23.6 TaxID=2760709 RepID=UPI00247397D8|nr:flagellar hook-length control protein FliK [Polaromonas sp. CG_23.6]MDH6184134.1 flagellar hook-length control protein FliK [Polaromonas sp. CG_23.6]
MSITLPASIGPAPSASPGGKASARADGQAQNQPGSFGEALARSRPPAEEKSVVKAATPARRQADPEKTEPQEMVNPMQALLTPFERRLAAEALPAGSASSGDNVLGRTDTAINDPLAETPLAEGATAEAPEVAADANAQAALADLLTAAGPKSAIQTPVKAGAAAIQDGTASASPTRAFAAQAGAASEDLSGPSAKQGDEDSAARQSGDARADLSLFAADATAGTSGALLLQPAGAVLQTSAGASALSTPAPVATALLAPPVGSSEWTKALGQQVIYMGTADHQIAELQLNPPGLGPLKVTLSINDQQMQAMFVSAHSSVRAAVEAALPQLRAQLAESGISLGNTSVGAESQPQTAFANGQNGQNGQSPRGSYRMAETDPLLPGRPVTAQVRSISTRIDTYA